MLPEEWRLVADFDGMYEVSSLGRVRSYRNGKWGRRGDSRLLEPRTANTGYLRVSLSRNNRTEYRSVHRLVAEAFLGPAPAGHEVGHLNGCRTDSALTNLAWVTRTENARHKIDHGTQVRGELHGQAKLSEAAVIEIRTRRQSGETLRSIAASLGISCTTVRSVALGLRWTHVA